MMRIKLILENVGVKKRKLLFLVDTDKCTNIADLSYLIKRRYFSCEGKVELFLDGFFIPQQEDLCIIHENDTIEVKFSPTEQKNGIAIDGICEKSVDAQISSGSSSSSESEIDNPPAKKKCNSTANNTKLPLKKAASTKVNTSLVKKSPVKSVNILKEGNNIVKRTKAKKTVVPKSNKTVAKKTIPLSQLGIRNVNKSPSSTDSSSSSEEEEPVEKKNVCPLRGKSPLVTKQKVCTQGSSSTIVSDNKVHAKKTSPSSSDSSDSSSDSSDSEKPQPGKKNNVPTLIAKTPVTKGTANKQNGNKCSNDNMYTKVNTPISNNANQNKGHSKNTKQTSSASSDSSDSSDNEGSQPAKKNNVPTLITKKPVTKGTVNKQNGNKCSNDNMYTKVNTPISNNVNQNKGHSKSTKHPSSSYSSDSSDNERPQPDKKDGQSLNAKKPVTKETVNKQNGNKCSNDNTYTKVSTPISNNVNQNKEHSKSTKQSSAASPGSISDSNDKQTLVNVDFEITKGKNLSSTPVEDQDKNADKPGSVINSRAKNLARKDVYKNTSQFVVAERRGINDDDNDTEKTSYIGATRKTRRKQRRRQNKNRYRDENGTTKTQNITSNNNEQELNSTTSLILNGSLTSDTTANSIPPSTPAGVEISNIDILIIDDDGNYENSNNNNGSNNINARLTLLSNGNHENNIGDGTMEPSVTLVVKDYSSCAELTTTPEVGSKIVYKILEMSTIHYTPEISEYKEACIKSIDQEKNILELQLSEVSQTKTKDDGVRGKFEMPVTDDEEILHTNSHSTAFVGWSELIEPRLLV